MRSEPFQQRTCQEIREYNNLSIGDKVRKILRDQVQQHREIKEWSESFGESWDLTGLSAYYYPLDTTYAVHWKFPELDSNKVDLCIKEEYRAAHWDFNLRLQEWAFDWGERMYGEGKKGAFQLSPIYTPIALCKTEKEASALSNYLLNLQNNVFAFCGYPHLQQYCDEFVVGTVHAFTSFGNSGLEKSWQCTQKQQEKRLQRYILGQIGHGRREVPTDYGNIDILTRDTLIELKHASKWKEAVGQVVVYGMDYPNYQKRIIIFGEQKPFRWGAIENCCKQSGIAIDFLQDTGYEYRQEAFLHRGWLVEQGKIFS